MKVGKGSLRFYVAALGVLCSASPAYGTILYANSAGGTGIQIFNVNVAAGTESLVRSFGVRESNGRGVVTVGDTLYYTDASSGSVSTYTLSTNRDNGALFTVAGASGLATIAYDGTNLFLGDYSGSNNVYKYSLGGALLSTVQLSECGVVHQGGTRGFCDGLEFANGGLVSNEGDGGFGGASRYDIYSLSGGTPTRAGLINTTFGATGIAYDGTDYFVSDIQNDRLAIYDTSGTFLKFIALADGNHTRAIEDLSVDYSQRPDTGGAPEPSTWVLMLSGVSLAGYRLYRNKSTAA